MEIIQASCSSGDLRPLLRYPRFRPRFSLSFASNRYGPIIHSPQRTSPLSLTLISSHRKSSSRQLFTTCQSVLDDGSAAVEVGEAGLPLEVMKKALDVSYGLKGTCIYLLGINSSMKTRVGNLLAEAFRYYYFDSDSLVVEAAGGESAAKVYKETNEDGFRESETEVLKQLSSMGRIVVSAGDGAVQSATNLGLVRYGISLWIDVPLDMVAEEVVEDRTRLPLADISISGSHPEVLSQLRELYKKMQSKYATADATVSLQRVAGKLGYDDVQAVTTEEMGLEVLKEIEKLMRVKKMMEEAAKPF